MAPPTVKPPTATRLRTPSGSAPVANTTVPVTAAPLVTAAPAAAGRRQRPWAGSPASRGATVAVAATTITASTGSTVSGARNTAPSSSPTASSWTAPRAADRQYFAWGDNRDRVRN